MEILTRRFRLRDFTAADAAAFRAYHEDPRYRALYGDGIADAAPGLLQQFIAWAAEKPRRNFQFAVTEREAPGRLIGCAGLRQAGFAPGQAEFGLELAADQWGRYGCAIEVAAALLRFGFGTLALDCIHGVSVPGRVDRLAAWFGASAGKPGTAADGSVTQPWRIVQAQWAAHEARPRHAMTLERRRAKA
jgi:ribosomal-protein-alanine N-acetyltransferase